ncbi:MAG TPA: dTDP-4-dehydrorhamnose 3,5-epimerase [Anaeromyxobacter sp.]
MKFTATRLEGVHQIDLEAREDDRGFFARSFCQQEFAAHGLATSVVQSNVSYNRRRGTLRGMHFQIAPAAEPKLVRCTRGRLFDVAVDLRPASATYCQWVGVELGGEAARTRMLYVPEGCAHGFQTLEDDTEVFYEMFAAYSAEHARGVRWDDPAFGIAWPLPAPILSEKDRSYPLYRRDDGPIR